MNRDASDTTCKESDCLHVLDVAGIGYNIIGIRSSSNNNTN